MTLGTVLLLVAAAYLGSRWLRARDENQRLVAEIATLKRRLALRKA